MVIGDGNTTIFLYNVFVFFFSFLVGFMSYASHIHILCFVYNGLVLTLTMKFVLYVEVYINTQTFKGIYLRSINGRSLQDF